jgi:spore coat protein U-like protein
MKRVLLKVLSIVVLLFMSNTAFAQSTCSFTQPSFVGAFGDITGGDEYFTSTTVSINCSAGLSYSLKPNIDYVSNGNSIILYQDSAYTKRLGTNPIVGVGTGGIVNIPIYLKATSLQKFVYKLGLISGPITMTITY